METYGLTLVEAMACKTPVVAFRVAESLKLRLMDGVRNYVNEKIAVHCSKQLRKLRDSPQLRTSLGHDAHQLARDRSAAGSFSRALCSCIKTALP